MNKRIQVLRWKIIISYLFKRSRLQLCCIASMHFFHVDSNSTGHFQNCGNWVNIAFLRSLSSAAGSPGLSLEPIGVHCLITSIPNIASFAILQARVPAFESPRSLGYFSTTCSMVESFVLSIIDDDRQFSLCCGFIIGSGDLIHFCRLEDDGLVAGDETFTDVEGAKVLVYGPAVLCRYDGC